MHQVRFRNKTRRDISNIFASIAFLAGSASFGGMIVHLSLGITLFAVAFVCAVIAMVTNPD